MEIRKYFLLAVVAACSDGCFTRSAMRAFDHALADDSILTVEHSNEQPASFRYEIMTDAAYKGVGWESRLSGSGEVRLPNDITSRCSSIAMYVLMSYVEADCRELSAAEWGTLQFIPHSDSPTGTSCKLPNSAVPECSVILLRSTATDVPVAAYHASDWSALDVVTRQTPDSGRWLKLAVSPFLDIGCAAVLVVAFIAIGLSAA